jgi:hypothetical protein
MAVTTRRMSGGAGGARHGLRPERPALAVGLLAQLVAGPALADARFADAFAYCAAVGTIDAPDARYTGPAMPEAVAQGLKAALDLPAAAPTGPIVGNSRWRCMDGKVYACTVGANLPCAEKADAGREPSAALVDFCRQNPGADVVPMAVTGRATVFAWRCTGAVAAIARQFARPDAAGYIADIWYEIARP